MPDIAYRTADVDGLTVFYREAGPAGAPTLVLYMARRTVGGIGASTPLILRHRISFNSKSSAKS